MSIQPSLSYKHSKTPFVLAGCVLVAMVGFQTVTGLDYRMVVAEILATLANCLVFMPFVEASRFWRHQAQNVLAHQLESALRRANESTLRIRPVGDRKN